MDKYNKQVAELAVEYIKGSQSTLQHVTFKEINWEDTYVDVLFSLPDMDQVKNSFCLNMHAIEKALKVKLTLTADTYYKLYTGKVTYGTRIFLDSI